MHPDKKIMFSLSVTLIIISFFSGCIIQDLLFGTSFSLISSDIIDDEGFPSLKILYSCSGMVTVNLFNPESVLIDSDFFFKGDSNTTLHLGSYKETLTSGVYTLKAYNKDKNEIFSKTFTYTPSELSISSCTQKWWTYDDENFLLALNMMVTNSGDIPLYPYNVSLEIGSNIINGLVLPCVILPSESKSIDTVIYKKDPSNDEYFTVTLKDNEGASLGFNTFSETIKSTVPTRVFTKGVKNELVVPYLDFLHDYYKNLDRIMQKDYSVYVFDPYDDLYLNVFIDQMISTLPFKDFKFNYMSDAEKIDLVANFVQNLDYREDVMVNGSNEYPNYPIETLFNTVGGCDCEDKAILTASLLYSDRLRYDVALFRFPNHMAVGVKLNKTAVPDYDYYTNNYFFLETTTEGKPIGFIPSEYRSPEELTVYTISSRPYLIHSWKNGVITIFTDTEIGDFVKVTCIVDNLGMEIANNVKITCAFYIQGSELSLNSNSYTISSLKPGMKKKVTLTSDIPTGYSTFFETRILYNDKIVDSATSNSSFP